MLNKYKVSMKKLLSNSNNNIYKAKFNNLTENQKLILDTLDEHKDVIIKEFNIINNNSFFKINELIPYILNINEKHYVSTIYDVLIENDIIYIIMKYLKGNDPINFIFKFFNDDDKIFHFYKIWTTIVYLHNLNIFHLDIKPENIVYNEETKNFDLIDFGASIYNNNKSINTKICGTLCFLPINKILYFKNKNYNVNHHINDDIWSYFLTCYYMLFNEYLFDYTKFCNDHILELLYFFNYEDNPLEIKNDYLLRYINKLNDVGRKRFNKKLNKNISKLNKKVASFFNIFIKKIRNINYFFNETSKRDKLQKIILKFFQKIYDSPVDENYPIEKINFKEIEKLNSLVKLNKRTDFLDINFLKDIIYDVCKLFNDFDIKYIYFAIELIKNYYSFTIGKNLIINDKQKIIQHSINIAKNYYENFIIEKDDLIFLSKFHFKYYTPNLYEFLNLEFLSLSSSIHIKDKKQIYCLASSLLILFILNTDYYDIIIKIILSTIILHCCSKNSDSLSVLSETQAMKLKRQNRAEGQAPKVTQLKCEKIELNENIKIIIFKSIFKNNNKFLNKISNKIIQKYKDNLTIV